MLRAPRPAAGGRFFVIGGESNSAYVTRKAEVYTP
jgi:hypothetical protein